MVILCITTGSNVRDTFNVKIWSMMPYTLTLTKNALYSKIELINLLDLTIKSTGLPVVDISTTSINSYCSCILTLLFSLLSLTWSYLSNTAHTSPMLAHTCPILLIHVPYLVIPVPYLVIPVLYCLYLSHNCPIPCHSCSILLIPVPYLVTPVQY